MTTTSSLPTFCRTGYFQLEPRSVGSEPQLPPSTSDFRISHGPASGHHRESRNTCTSVRHWSTSTPHSAMRPTFRVHRGRQHSPSVRLSGPTPVIPPFLTRGGRGAVGPPGGE